MNINLGLTSKEHKDLLSYCKLNNFDPETILKSSYLEGFKIEKYGLLSGKVGGTQEKQVGKEIIREKRVEIPVEVIKEVVKIEYVEVPVEVVKYVETPVEIIKEIEVIQYVDREVIKEVPVEIIKEKIVNIIQEVPVEKIVYIHDKKEEEVVTNLDNICDKPEPIIIEKIVEVPVEVIKEVIVEKEVIKEVIVENDTDSKLKPKLDALQNTVQKLKLDNIEKDKLIKEYEKTIQDIQKFNEGTKVMYLKGSNLDDKLYNK
jgi:hypothetical protein